MQKLEVRDGDVVVVMFPSTPPLNAIAEVKKHVSAIVGDNIKVLILSGGAELGVLTKSTPRMQMNKVVDSNNNVSFCYGPVSGYSGIIKRYAVTYRNERNGVETTIIENALSSGDAISQVELRIKGNYPRCHVIRIAPDTSSANPPRGDKTSCESCTLVDCRGCPIMEKKPSLPSEE
jgi:hypothetical protein